MNTQEPPFKPTINADATGATIRFRARTVNLSASELEEMIAWLGHLRSQLKPAVPVSCEGVETIFYADHCFAAPLQKGEAQAPTEAGAAIYFQSPLFGWFQYPAPAEFCRMLADWLQGHPGGLSKVPSGASLQ
jgi:hypothetical protein